MTLLPSRGRATAFLLDYLRGDGVGTEVDPLFSQVVLLLNGNGPNTHQTLLDESTYNRANVATPTGANSTTYAKFGSGSIACNVFGGGGGAQWNDTDDFNLSTLDWTVEGFLLLPAIYGTNHWLMGHCSFAAPTAEASWVAQQTAAGKLRFASLDPTQYIGDITSTTSLTAGVWWYFRYGREGTTFRLYMGTSGTATLQGTATSSASINNSPGAFRLGAFGSYPNDWSEVYYDAFRWTIGSWRGNDPVVPTAPWPLGAP